MALIGTTGDETWPPVAESGGPAVKKYDVEVNGVTTTLKLSDADAKARGLLKTAAKAETKAKAPANKSATPANKSASSKQAEAK
jgi:hypothetical protein